VIWRRCRLLKKNGVGAYYGMVHGGLVGVLRGGEKNPTASINYTNSFKRHSCLLQISISFNINIY
jgi:hypothetical protein